MKYFKIRGL